jgi:hypothetical protein
MSPFWCLEPSGGSEILGKFVQSWNRVFLNYRLWINTNYGSLGTNFFLLAALMNFSVKAAYETLSFLSDIHTLKMPLSVAIWKIRQGAVMQTKCLCVDGQCSVSRLFVWHLQTTAASCFAKHCDFSDLPMTLTARAITELRHYLRAVSFTVTCPIWRIARKGKEVLWFFYWLQWLYSLEQKTAVRPWVIGVEQECQIVRGPNGTF